MAYHFACITLLLALMLVTYGVKTTLRRMLLAMTDRIVPSSMFIEAVVVIAVMVFVNAGTDGESLLTRIMSHAYLTLYFASIVICTAYIVTIISLLGYCLTLAQIGGALNRERLSKVGNAMPVFFVAAITYVICVLWFQVIQ